MPNLVPLLADSSSNLLAARSQMGFTLGFHIVLACFGVAFPAMMLIAEWRGRKRNDEAALRLARNWSKAVAVMFAVGAVSGTVLTFEFGLLWPRFMDRFGDAFGVAFAIEGIFFFLEAIFIAIYIYGWDRLSPKAHMWAAVPIVVSGVGGAFSVIAANSWMNQPQGFTLDSAGKVTDVQPLQVLTNSAAGYEFAHMLLAAYMVTGFLLASVYAVGMLRGKRDRYHRLGVIIPLTVAAIATPFQFLVGDTAARAIANDQPAKFAAMECVYKGGPDQTEYLGGRCVDGQVKGGIGIPGLDSYLVGFSKNTDVTGLNQIPVERPAPGPDDAPPLLRHDGRGREPADPARRLVRGRLVPEEGPAPDEVVPPGGRDLGRRHGGGAGVRLDRHRGGTPALDRERLHAHLPGRDPGAGDLVGVRHHARDLCRPRSDRGRRPPRAFPPLAVRQGGRRVSLQPAARDPAD